MSTHSTDRTESDAPSTASDASPAPLPAIAALRAPPIFETIESAAPKLGVAPGALRSRCQRAARRIGAASAVAQLGGGIVAFKFGKTWRLRFPNP
jgi:hypothetical protein